MNNSVQELQEMKEFLVSAVENSRKNIQIRERQIRAIEEAIAAMTAGHTGKVSDGTGHC